MININIRMIYSRQKGMLGRHINTCTLTSEHTHASHEHTRALSSSIASTATEVYQDYDFIILWIKIIFRK